MGVHLNRLARPRQRSLSLRTRLLIAGGLNVALLLVIAAGALWQLDAMRRQFGRVVEVHGRHASLAHQLKAAQLEWTERLRALLVVNDPGDLQAMLSSLQAARQRYLEAESALDSELQGEEEANITLRQPLRELQQVREQIASVYEAAARSLQGGSGIEGALALLLPAEAAEARWRQQIGDIVEVTSRASQAEFSDGIAGQRRASYGVSAAMSAAVLIALVMGWSLARSITRPVAEAVGAAEAIANGWLDEPIAVVQRDDEFGRLAAAMAEMRSRLRDSVGAIRRSSETVLGASQEISAGSRDLSVRTEQAATKLQESNGAVRDLAQTVAASLESASQARNMAGGARHAAHQGDEAVARLRAQMQHIADASRKIAEIVELIDAIAFQTNVLALNASVEAARAGDRGRGFGVVAAEVRQLAQRAAEAAGQIRALSSETRSSVDRGADSVTEAGAAVTRLVETSNDVVGRIDEVAATAVRQREVLVTIEQAIAQLDEATQRNSALGEQLAASAATLEDRASVLQSLMAAFRLGGDQEVSTHIDGTAAGEKA